MNHPVTFFRGLCLSLGVKGRAPKGAWADEVRLSLSSALLKPFLKSL